MNKGIKRWFKFDCIFKSFLKYTGSGDVLYEADEPVKVLITGESQTIILLDGKEYVSQYVVFIDAADIPIVKVDDKLTVLGKQYVVRQAKIVPNKFGQIDLWIVVL